MNRDQALKVIKGAFETVKKAAQTDDYAKKCGLLMALEAFSNQVDEAIKVLEGEAE